jgi:hypothetical protein
VEAAVSAPHAFAREGQRMCARAGCASRNVWPSRFCEAHTIGPLPAAPPVREHYHRGRGRDLDAAVLAALFDVESMTFAELHERLGCALRHAQEATNRQIRAGHVERVTRGVYALTFAGRLTLKRRRHSHRVSAGMKAAR